MSDFFADLENELRRAHRRDSERHAISRVFDLRRLLPVLPAPGLPALVALAMVVALVAVVLTVARESAVDRPAAPPPQPSLLPTNPPTPEGCLPSQYWRAPIVDEPIPPAIASRIAIFREPRPSGELPRDFPIYPGSAAKKYRGVVTLRPRLDTGAQLRVDMIAVDLTSEQPAHDPCTPPLDPTVPGICVYAFDPNGPTGPQGTRGETGCFSVETIEDGRAWFKLTRQTVFGLAPDGFDRVTFDTPEGAQSLSISDNVFAGEIRSATSPDDPPPGGPPGPPATNTRFTP